MAKIFGRRSRYLIFSDYFARIGAVLFYFTLLFILFKFFGTNAFGKAITIVSLFVSTVLYFLIAYYCVRGLGKYILISKNFKQGRNGEYEVCDELERFSEEYLIFQDVKLSGMRGANIDFVVLGPTGIYAIEVKNHPGRANLEGKKGRGFHYQTMKGAKHLHDYILQTTGRKYFVNPVLVFSRADVRFGLKPQKNIYVIGRTYLKKLILSDRNILGESDILLVKKELLKIVRNEGIKE